MHPPYHLHMHVMHGWTVYIYAKTQVNNYHPIPVQQCKKLTGLIGNTTKLIAWKTNTSEKIK